MILLLRDLILKDFWLKLFSLALGVLTWFTISFAIQQQVLSTPSLPLNTKERTFYNLPVVVMSAAEDVRSFKVTPNEVAVTVQGEGKILQKLQSDQIRAMVDLTGVSTAHEFRKRIEVSTPAGVTHVRVNPPEVDVIFPAKPIRPPN